MIILEHHSCFKIISFDITGEEYMCMNVKAVRILLDMMQYLRQQTRPKQGYVGNNFLPRFLPQRLQMLFVTR